MKGVSVLSEERLTEKLQLYAKLYKEPPYEREVEGTVELLETAAEELEKYHSLEEQGLLLRLPISVSELVDKLFSHNETIALWEKRKDEISYHYLLWKGMAWDIPRAYAECKFVKIFGSIPEKITDADAINVEIIKSEAEEKLRELEGK